MEKPKRTGWGPVTVGVLAIICVVTASAWGYWQYLNTVPPFVPRLPPGPSPNGYVLAEHAALALEATMPPTPIIPPVAGGPPAPPPEPNWPNGTAAEIRARLLRVRPILSEVRAQFHYGWSAATDLTDFNGRPPFTGFRECARGFAAESILRRKKGDYAGAMPPALDAMELAARSARGGARVHWRVAGAIHRIGLGEAERLALQQPAAAIPATLARVHRLKGEWPRLPEMFEADRVFTRVALTAQLGRFRVQSPLQQWREMSGNGSSNAVDSVRLLLIPRHVALADIDDYYRRLTAESRRPLRQRQSIPLPRDPWVELAVSFVPVDDLWKLERARTDLALLEVDLAVRMYYLEQGLYPTRLTEISHRWLPGVPRDLWDQPIAYRLKNGQPVIYSLGPDGKDDGGLPADPIDLTPATRGDLVFGHLSHHLHGR